MRGLLGPPARPQEPARRRALRRRHARPARLPRPRLRRVRAVAHRVGRPVRPGRVREPLRRPGRRRRSRPRDRTAAGRHRGGSRRPSSTRSSAAARRSAPDSTQVVAVDDQGPSDVSFEGRRASAWSGRCRSTTCSWRAGLVRHRRRAGRAPGRLARGPGGRPVLRPRRRRDLGRRAPADDGRRGLAGRDRSGAGRVHLDLPGAVVPVPPGPVGERVAAAGARTAGRSRPWGPRASATRACRPSSPSACCSASRGGRDARRGHPRGQGGSALAARRTRAEWSKGLPCWATRRWSWAGVAAPPERACGGAMKPPAAKPAREACLREPAHPQGEARRRRAGGGRLQEPDGRHRGLPARRSARQPVPRILALSEDAPLATAAGDHARRALRRVGRGRPARAGRGRLRAHVPLQPPLRPLLRQPARGLRRGAGAGARHRAQPRRSSTRSRTRAASTC